MKMFIGACAAILLISGCAHKPPPEVVTKIETRKIEVPKYLMECEHQPQVLEAWKSQKEVGIFIIHLSEAGEDCRQKLNGINKLIENHNDIK